MTHEPVMLNEVIKILDTYLGGREKLTVLDGTLGAGGYSEKILERFSNSEVFGVDRDELAVRMATERLCQFCHRFRVFHDKFSITNFGGTLFDGLVFDLGVSNMQITIPERGFSFQNDGKLDMRMDATGGALTASDVLGKLSEKELADIFREYGEERYAKLIAKGIKKYPQKIETTAELVKVIRGTLPQPIQRKMGTHPARRIFQALRIYVNDEMGELGRLLERIPRIANVRDGAVVIIVSYHSLEDRAVKRVFRRWAMEEKLGILITRHPITPSQEELEKNSKSHSGKLRAIFLKKN